VLFRGNIVEELKERAERITKKYNAIYNFMNSL